MKKFLFFSSVLVILWIVFVVIIVLSNLTQQKQITKPTTIPAIDHNSGPAVPGQTKPSQNEQIELDKQSKLGDLINVLPHQESYFGLVYDFDKSVFVLSLSKTNIQQGNTDFDLFIKSHGFKDRSWFTNLTTVYR